MVIDPVCGMLVEPARAAKTEYEGKEYYFCSLTCRDRFEKSPGEYLDMGRGDRARELYDQMRFLMRHLYSPISTGEVARDLTTTELFTVETVGRSGKTSMSKLAGECDLSLSTMTGVVDRLVKKGCIKRERTEEDRRLVMVELTERGGRAYQERLEADMRLILSMLAALSYEEQDAILKYLGKIVGSMQGD